MKDLPDSMQPQAAPGTWECVFDLLPPPARVLNVGAGRGGISWLLQNAGYAVTSVDLHPDHFVADGLQCEYADLNQNLPFGDAQFDIVVAVEVIEHLENPWHFVREAVRVLAPGGVLLVTSPNVSSLPSRLAYLLEGFFPYFREESFVGCYHATPIFPWTLERCCGTTGAQVERIAYSRIDWPRGNDIPRHDGGKGLRRMLLDWLPLNGLTGEIACYLVRKTDAAPKVAVGVHYR
jgi:SAM-dependent methyltransferase